MLPNNKRSFVMQLQQPSTQESLKQNLDALFNPFIRVVPEDDWSKIKAIWIPFLHHDYKNQLEKSEKITILQPSVDKFGTIQGYLTAPNEDYIPYKTTFFNPTWTQDLIIEKIMQAYENILETQCIIFDTNHEKIIRKTIIGVTKSGMLIAITLNHAEQIIDAFPIFESKISDAAIMMKEQI